jgi:cell division protein FtsL
MWGSTAMVVIAVAFALLAVVNLRARQTALGYEIERLQAERARLESERRHWTAEIESLRMPQRIEALAIGTLMLVKPSASDAFVIERVRTSPEPSSAIVARR